MICLNMIVKNEARNLPRLLESVQPHIDAAVVCDTGSTDGTQQLVRDFCAKRKIQLELHEIPFIDFGEARNKALGRARASKMDFDWLLLADADMELVVEDQGWTEGLDFSKAYRMLQKAGPALSYWNTRLVDRKNLAHYVGPTHEYLDCGSTRNLEGAFFLDHADGSNRAGKFARDIGLLQTAVEKDPTDARSWFYLGQSYRDAGQLQQARSTFAHRALMGGWDEEVWRAKLEEARAARKLGDIGGFVAGALEAYSSRPTRAEPLYDLAAYYRLKGENAAAFLFADKGLAIPRPDDLLFVEDSIYTHNLASEFSIVAWYTPARAKGAEVCNRLALDRSAAPEVRNLARRNLFFYAQPLNELAPSFEAKSFDFEPPVGWYATNPSITNHDGQLWATIRAVNSVREPSGRYVYEGKIRTRNFLARLSEDLSVASCRELRGLPEPAADHVVAGLEDMRLFSWRGYLQAVACTRQLDPRSRAQQVLCPIDGDDPMVLPSGEAHEKNWMPLVGFDDSPDNLNFIHWCDPTRILDAEGRPTRESTPAFAADNFRGGSQAIPFDEGWLALVHEVKDDGGPRTYQHRFIWLDEELSLKKVSPRFTFGKGPIEFAAGLVARGECLLLSFGAQDQSAWVGKINRAEVRDLLA